MFSGDAPPAKKPVDVTRVSCGNFGFNVYHTEEDSNNENHFDGLIGAHDTSGSMGAGLDSNSGYYSSRGLSR